MSIKGFKLTDNSVEQYDYNYLDNIPGLDTKLNTVGIAAQAKTVGDAIYANQTMNINNAAYIFFRFGIITTSNGIQDSTTSVISNTIDTSDCDYVEIYLLDSNYRYAIYFENDTPGTYGLIDSGFKTTNWILYNTNRKYIFRIDAIQGYTFNKEEAKKALKFTFHKKYNSLYTHKIITNNNIEYIDNMIEFEQGRLTSQGSIEDIHYVRTTNFLHEDFAILNPDHLLYSVLSYNLNGDFLSYVTAGNHLVSTNTFDDELFFLTTSEARLYKIIVHNYLASVFSPDNNTLRILIKNTSKESEIIENVTKELSRQNTNLFFKLGVITSTGIRDSNTSVISDSIDTSNCEYVKIHLENNNYRYAIYFETETEGTYGLIDGGFKTDDYIIYNTNRKYIFRIDAITGYSFKYSEAKNVLKFEFCKKTEKYAGYKRIYSDITNSLTFINKSIASTGITDSTIDLMAQLPNNGNVEVKMNASMGKFAVYKKASDGSISLLNGGFSHYQYRYTGDYTSEYYARVRLEANGTIVPYQGPQIIRVYTYNDTGTSYYRYSYLRGRNIAFFGDSIVQGRYPKNASSVNICMSSPYSILISEQLGDLTPNNFGIGGGLVYNSDWKSMYANVSKITGFDVVFFCAGTNDYGANINSTDFRSAYEYVVNNLKTNNSKVILMTPTARQNMTNTNSVNMSLLDYSTIIKDIATTNNLVLIDLTTLTNNTDFLNHLPDGLHPDEIGHQIIANLILDNIY